jgi:hypothetical protein
VGVKHAVWGRTSAAVTSHAGLLHGFEQQELARGRGPKRGPKLPLYQTCLVVLVNNLRYRC